MAMDATFQIRMNSELKSEVESFYRNLGTSFAEASASLRSKVFVKAVCPLPRP